MEANRVVLFDVCFIMLLAGFGVGVTGINFNSLSAIPQPPTSQLPSINCNGLCSPLSGIVQATAYIGWAIVNLPVFLGYLIIVVITFLNILLLITFSQGLSANGIPVVGFFFLGLQFVVIEKVFIIFRGSASGG